MSMWRRTRRVTLYDLDGNLTNDGRWTYTWDGENRLMNMTNIAGADGVEIWLDFIYD